MMEVLYRGKDRQGNWRYGYLVMHDENPFIYTDEAGKFDKCGIYEVTPSSVGMYTNLKDKNKKKIFGAVGEKGGDIVIDGDDKFRVSFGEYDKTNVTHIGFYLTPLTNDTFVIETLWSGCEIIGNMTDTPQLVEGERNVN